MKKYFSKAAAAMLALTMASAAVTPVMAAIAYKDVPENVWYAESVAYVTENGIMKGVSDNEFAPETKLTRGMIVAILYRLEGEPDVSAVKAFNDVPADAYYADAVAWASENGIVYGTGDGKFSPDNNVTREQLAKILLGYYTYKGNGPVDDWAIRLDYTDLPEASDWATEGIMFCTMKGLMQGKDGNSFDPKGETTRAEIAAVIERMAGDKASDTEFEIQPLVGEPTDYSDKDNWLAIPEITHDVDTVYLYPTTFLDDSEGAELICDVDNEMMRTGARNMYESQATVYEESTNVFAPYYRQSNVMIVGQLRGDDVTDIQMKEPRTDVYAALDYYFENYNNGRPFILAGHSQGSTMTMLVLGEYMQAHPEYYERMVAAYPIGFSITQEWLDEHPYTKFAEGADDTGVIVSWNTEGPGNKGQSSLVIEPGAISINPLNWKRDDTYATVEENLGSLVKNEETGEYELAEGIADAQIDTERGVVVCTTNDSFIPMEDIFGPQSLHGGDYTLYYGNIQKNVADRIAAYLENK
ncbi:MAG: DUF3089 domain-containing protein [Oscillospiraceae bacterium]|nr:DUF3089 domain-containing protein [Oscillospiraceae bacterium]